MPPSDTAVSDKIKELQSVQSQVRFWRTLTVIAIILIVVTCVSLMSQAVNQLTTPSATQQAFMNKLLSGITNQVVPEVQRIVSLAAADSAPVLQAELDQLDQRAPEFAQGLRGELYQFSLGVNERSEAVLNEVIGGHFEQQRNWIESNLERVDTESAERLAVNIAQTAHDRVRRIADGFYSNQVQALNRINADLRRIRDEEADNVREISPNWDMSLLFLGLMRDEFRELEEWNPPVTGMSGVGGSAPSSESAASEDEPSNPQPNSQ